MSALISNDSLNFTVNFYQCDIVNELRVIYFKAKCKSSVVMIYIEQEYDLMKTLINVVYHFLISSDIS